MTGELRRDVRDIFGCSVIDGYSAEETGHIASQCPATSNLHVADELILLEVVDIETGEPCPPGQPGRVLVTSFFNHAMPLIRYEIGDVAVLAGDCACGRQLTTITRIEGRLRQLFRFAGGRTVFPGLPGDSYATQLGASQWQTAQTAIDAVEIRFVSDWPEARQDRDGLAAIARHWLGEGLQISFRQMDRIPRQPSGKLFQYICELESSPSSGR